MSPYLCVRLISGTIVQQRKTSFVQKWLPSTCSPQARKALRFSNLHSLCLFAWGPQACKALRLPNLHSLCHVTWRPLATKSSIALWHPQPTSPGMYVSGATDSTTASPYRMNSMNSDADLKHCSQWLRKQYWTGRDFWLKFCIGVHVSLRWTIR